MENRLKLEIFNEMVAYAENPLRFSCREEPSFIDIYGRSLKIKGFKPSIADKLQFRKLIEEKGDMLNHFYAEEMNDEGNKSERAFVIEAWHKLIANYFSRYGYELAN